jgi:hypothetical protein
MSRSSTLGAVLYSTESAWAENSTTCSTRLSILGEVDASGLVQEMLAPGRVTQYKQDGTKGVPGVQGGEFKLRHHLPGHGTTCAGAMSATALVTYLGYVFGANATGPTGTTFTGGTAAVPTTTAASGFAVGGMGRAGAINDARGGGQWFAVTSHAANSLTLLGALPAAPNAADVCYSSEVVHATEGPNTSAMTGLRFRLQTANQTFVCHGCYPKAVAFSGISNGGIPEIEVTWGVSWFEPVSVTFPDATAVNVFTPAPVAAGSLFLQAKSTTTRQTFTVHDFRLGYTLGVVPIMGPGGVSTYQNVIGARRTPDAIDVEIDLEAESNTATPTWWGNWATNGEWHMLYGMSIADGSAMAMYMPRMCVTGQRPTQKSVDGINRLSVKFMAYTSDTLTSTDLALSAFRMAFA